MPEQMTMLQSASCRAQNIRSPTREHAIQPSDSLRSALIITEPMHRDIPRTTTRMPRILETTTQAIRLRTHPLADIEQPTTKSHGFCTKTNMADSMRPCPLTVLRVAPPTEFLATLPRQVEIRLANTLRPHTQTVLQLAVSTQIPSGTTRVSEASIMTASMPTTPPHAQEHMRTATGMLFDPRCRSCVSDLLRDDLSHLWMVL
jgi:hypothetical protein